LNNVVEVKLWGVTIGFIGYPDKNDTEVCVFEYDKDFAQTSIQISPLEMAHPPIKHRFSGLSQHTFGGIPGVFADSLPDKFGNQLIDQFMAKRGISKNKITPLDRLLYIGDRGMGALEYHPLKKNLFEDSGVLDIQMLSELTNLILQKNNIFREKLHNTKTKSEALKLIKVGSSAGGARAKALVAIKDDGNFYDGTQIYDDNTTYWLLKFDSPQDSDRDGKDPKGLTKIEYIYSLIAKRCNIDIPNTKFIETDNDFHFLIERFDRELRDKRKAAKIHYLSWAGLSHYDRENTGSYSYEQLITNIRELDIGEDATKEVFRRAIFNIVGRNQDDHTKNFGFLMDKSGDWRLSPAFDLTYSFDPRGSWTRVHQIRLNEKQDNFTKEDITNFGKKCNLNKNTSLEILEKTVYEFSKFEELAKKYNVDDTLLKTVKQNQRLIQ